MILTQFYVFLLVDAVTRISIARKQRFNEKNSPLILFTIFALSLQPVAAQVKLSDSARITLLTASPWYEAVYSLFGHTAIRVQDDSTGIDAVFNYGYFDSSQPHFIYHFIRGRPTTCLG